MLAERETAVRVAEQLMKGSARDVTARSAGAAPGPGASHADKDTAEMV